MKTITLTILAEDILLDNYKDYKDCPITKALHRAGYLNLEDIGFISGTDNDGNKITIDNNGIVYNDTYNNLVVKLFGMYNTISYRHFNIKGVVIPSIPVETFVHTLIY